MLGRFLLSLYLQTAAGSRMLEGFESGGSGVHVRAPDYVSRLRYIIPALVVIAIVFPIFANKYLLTVVILGLIYVLLGTGLNIVVGTAGLLDWVTWRSMPSAPTAALGYQYLGWASGAYCHWRLSLRRWQGASSASRCYGCTVTTWRS